MQIYAVAADNSVQSFKPDSDVRLVAVRVIADVEIDGLGNSFERSEEQSVVISFSGISYAEAVNGAVANHRSTIISGGGILAFPVEIQKGESIYISAAKTSTVLLYLS